MPLDSFWQTFVEDGRKAFFANTPRNKNPHPQDTGPYYLWDRGWEQGKKEKAFSLKAKML